MKRQNRWKRIAGRSLSLLLAWVLVLVTLPADTGGALAFVHAAETEEELLPEALRKDTQADVSGGEGKPASIAEEDVPGAVENENDCVTIVGHFLNSHNWERVAAYAKHHENGDWRDPISGYERYGDSWPGEEIFPDAGHPGWYSVEIVKDRSKGLAIIFNNNNQNFQTKDLIIDSDQFTSESYEFWVWMEDEGDKKTTKITATAPDSWTNAYRNLEISNRYVTFRYKSQGGDSKVQIAGTMVPDRWWTPLDMTKGENDLYTYTTGRLEVGKEYQYKYVLNDDWRLDPQNQNNYIITDNNNQNSAFIVTGLRNAEVYLKNGDTPLPAKLKMLHANGKSTWETEEEVAYSLESPVTGVTLDPEAKVIRTDGT